LSTDSAEKAVGLTRFLGRSLPPSRIIFLAIIAFSFIIGAVTGLAAIAWGAPLADAAYDAIRAVFLIAVPALLGAVACIGLKRKIRYKQMMFLGLMSAALYGAFYFLHYSGALELAGVSPQNSFNLLLLGNAFVFALWFIVARIVFNLKYTSYLFALITPTLNVMFLLADKSLGSPESISVLTRLYFASFIFLAAIYAVFWLVNAPMKRNFGVSMTDAASLFLAQWFEASPKLEAMFEEVAESVSTHLGVLAFRSEGRLKAVFVIPHVHYGPFGTLGGSEFPRLISEEVKRRTGADAFVFHGCATHDFNPASAGELEKFCSRLFRQLDGMKYAKAKGWLAVGRNGGAKTVSAMVNGIMFAPLTRAPRTTEDVDFSVGLAIRNYALAKGAGEALVLDAHNAETGEISKVESGNPIAFEYMEAVADALSQGKAEKPLKAGFAFDAMKGLKSKGAVGGAGMGAAVFACDGKKFAYVLFDANGAVPSFRRELIDAVCALGIDECEILSTDTHSVNKVSGVLNPLGGKGTDKKEITSRAVEAAKKALSGLGEVEAGGALLLVEDVKVFGVAQSSELLGTVNSIVAVVRVIAPLALVGATAAALWAMTKL